MITKQDIKQCAYDLGADLCGIASVDRFEQAPAGFHPKDIYPEVRTIVVIARRFPEGPFHAKSIIPYSATNDVLIEDMVHMTCHLGMELEKRLHIMAVPVVSEPYEYWDEEKREGKGILSLKHAGMLAGMGHIGKNTLLTHKVYGNRLSLGAVLLNIDIEPDPLEDETLCQDDCRRCIEACPVSAISDIGVNQKRCRSHSGRKTSKGYALTVCKVCRQVCPHGKGDQPWN